MENPSLLQHRCTRFYVSDGSTLLKLFLIPPMLGQST